MRGGNAFTLIEMLVAMAVFAALGAMLVSMVTAGLAAWRVGERRRISYERARAVFDRLEKDLLTAYTLEPVPRPGTVPAARFICYREPGSMRQTLAFVRTFETGPERAFTHFAGRGSKVYEGGQAHAADPAALGALGGLLGVRYIHDGRELKRAVRAPPSDRLYDPAGGKGEVIAKDMLYVGYRFWSQVTSSWKDVAPSRKRGALSGPETVWDSTRGASLAEVDPGTKRRRPFVMARGKASLEDPGDDVFPEIVEIMLVIEPDEARAVKTDLTRPLSESDSVAFVASTRGFPDPSEVRVCLLIDREWVECSEKRNRSFVLSGRGLRHTARARHARGGIVRVGTSFVMRVGVPGKREDWSSDKDFLRKQGGQ